MQKHLLEVITASERWYCGQESKGKNMQPLYSPLGNKN
jgi:hypothetical protein